MRIVPVIVGSLIVFGLGVVVGSYVTDAHAREQRQPVKRVEPKTKLARITDSTDYKLKMLDRKLDALDKRLRDFATQNSYERIKQLRLQTRELTNHIDLRFLANLGGATWDAAANKPKTKYFPWWYQYLVTHIRDKCR